MKRKTHFTYVLFIIFLLVAVISHSQEILVFSKTAGYRHASITAGIEALKKMGEKNTWKVTFTEDASVFNDTFLSGKEAVVFLSTTGNVLDEQQQKAFEKYIKSGGGYVGIHGATDTEYDWPWYGNLAGAYFSDHPKIQQGRIKILNNTHPATKHLQNEWIHIEEWYNFKEPVKKDCIILMEVDETSYEGGKMGTHPVSWYHNFDGGRSFYTALGHRNESYSNDAIFLNHIEGGIKWAAGLEK
jgi:type 1 glutamine amidotransferase